MTRITVIGLDWIIDSLRNLNVREIEVYVNGGDAVLVGLGGRLSLFVHQCLYGVIAVADGVNGRCHQSFTYLVLPQHLTGIDMIFVVHAPHVSSPFR